MSTDRPSARHLAIWGRSRAAQLRLLEGDEEVERRRLRGRALPLHREQEPLESGAEPDAGRFPSADRLDEPVVAAAPADGGVDVLLRPDELEGGARVVVEAAHERRVEDVVDAVRVEVRPDCFEVLAAFVAERVADLRRVGEGREDLLVLDVEDLEDARGALVGDLLVDQLGMRIEPLVEPGDVLRTAVRVADRVEAQLPLRHAEAAQELGVVLDHLGIHRRIRRADRLERQLPVLAVPPAAGSPVAIHGRDRVRLHGLRLLREAVLDVGARDRSGSLGAQRDRAAAAILERVHLLVHDVGSLPRCALEEGRLLEARRRDARPAVLRALFLDRADHAPPQMVAR